MRYIDINGLTVDPQWQGGAEGAARETKNAVSLEERKKKIAANEHIWKQLKDTLRSYSHEKCWYCESKDIRSDNAVDHYRPKNNVRDTKPPHDGYWWLAFDWRNFRFSCTYCNSIRSAGGSSGGKHDYFPLANEAFRARSHDAPLLKEDPLLLDPTNPLDVGLIAFADDGSAGPAESQADNSLDYRKGDESVRRYHLNQPSLVELRLARMIEVRGWLKEADDLLDLYDQAKGTENAIPRNAAAPRIREIMRAFAPDAPYSSAVKHYLAGMKGRSRAANAALTAGLGF